MREEELLIRSESESQQRNVEHICTALVPNSTAEQSGGRKVFMPRKLNSHHTRPVQSINLIGTGAKSAVQAFSLNSVLSRPLHGLYMAAWCSRHSMRSWVVPLLWMVLTARADATPRVAIVGGGVGGTAAAYFLRQVNPSWHIEL
jgi:hypothetical protein